MEYLAEVRGAECGVRSEARESAFTSHAARRTPHGLDLAVWCRRFERAVGQRHELVIAKKVGRLLLHDAQHLNGQLPDLDLGVTAGPHLDKVPQRPCVGGHEDLRL